MNHAEKIKHLSACAIVCGMTWANPLSSPECRPAFNAAEAELHAAIDEMQAEIDRLRQDAARYARLKDDFSVVSPDIDGYHVWAYKRNYSLRGANLDEAIDAAMKERGEGL